LPLLLIVPLGPLMQWKRADLEGVIQCLSVATAIALLIKLATRPHLMGLDPKTCAQATCALARVMGFHCRMSLADCNYAHGFSPSLEKGVWALER
jgi:cytochrome c biogenesis factor